MIIIPDPGPTPIADLFFYGCVALALLIGLIGGVSYMVAMAIEDYRDWRVDHPRVGKEPRDG